MLHHTNIDAAQLVRTGHFLFQKLPQQPDVQMRGRIDGNNGPLLGAQEIDHLLQLTLRQGDKVEGAVEGSVREGFVRRGGVDSREDCARQKHSKIGGDLWDNMSIGQKT